MLKTEKGGLWFHKNRLIILATFIFEVSIFFPRFVKGYLMNY